MKITGLNANKAEKLLHILRRWDKYISYYIDESDELYTISICSSVPYIFYYNYPTATFELGCDVVKLDVDEFVDITII